MRSRLRALILCFARCEPPFGSTRTTPLICAVLFFVNTCAAADPSPAQQAHVFNASLPHPVHLSYLLFLPAGYSIQQQERWPLILYLHGGSLRGDDVARVKTLGLPHKLEKDVDFPFVVVSPQCSAGEIWTDAEAVDGLLTQVIQDYRIDGDRVYVTGHSMGGRGALYLAYRLPGRFAAVLALSPLAPITAWAETLARIPMWLFHGSADTLAPTADTKELVRAIENAAGHPRLDVLPNRDHFILDIYERHDIYEWLLQQKRSASVRPRDTSNSQPSR